VSERYTEKGTERDGCCVSKKYFRETQRNACQVAVHQRVEVITKIVTIVRSPQEVQRFGQKKIPGVGQVQEKGRFQERRWPPSLAATLSWLLTSQSLFQRKVGQSSWIVSHNQADVWRSPSSVALSDPSRNTVFVRGVLLWGERMEDLPPPQTELGPGAGQGVGGVHKQQEEGGPSLETEGGQRWGEAGHLGLSCDCSLQTRRGPNTSLWSRQRTALPNLLSQICNWNIPNWCHPQSRVPPNLQGGACLHLPYTLLFWQTTHAEIWRELVETSASISLHTGWERQGGKWAQSRRLHINGAWRRTLWRGAEPDRLCATVPPTPLAPSSPSSPTIPQHQPPS